MPTQRIGILGGGFGGLYTALRLQQFPWPQDQRPEIVLVDHNERFVFLPFLYELITDEMELWEVAPPFDCLLNGTGVRFVQANVEAIDPLTQTVRLDREDPLICDRLVLALGGETPLDTVPGAQAHALPFRTLADAEALKTRLAGLETRSSPVIRIAVVGAGPSGVELSCKLADRLGTRGQVQLIDRNPQILHRGADYSRQAAERALRQRRVQLTLNAEVANVGADQLTLVAEGVPQPVDLVLWTVGNTMSNVISALDLPKNSFGQLLITPTLQVQDHPDLFALGDLADGQDAKGQPIPKTAQAAFQQTTYAAWNIWASLTGRSLLPFRYSHLGEMLTLGKEEAALAGLGMTLDGPLASVARRLIYLGRFPTLQHQVNVGVNWLLKPFQFSGSERGV
jgi:demethylphylloquinone reductase